MAKHRHTIAVDFDGVIHSYVTKWISHEIIPDPPVIGAIEWLNEIQQTFHIVIFTTRAQTADGTNAVREWLALHGANIDMLEITAQKPAALIYIDDRAWRFEGVFPNAEDVYNARPWWQKIKK